MSVEKLLPNLIRASLDGDYRTTRSVAMRLIRKIKNTHPEISNEIAKALSEHGVGASAKRGVGVTDSPLDSETFQSLARIDEPIYVREPVFSDRLKRSLVNFINERNQSTKLLSVGLSPPSSILLYGPPGVGKTHLAKYLSGALDLNLITLDLSSSISSYLGKTGQNLKKVLDYAKSSPSILLLDEFDAVAKKRDDMSDLGELKRIVNVLLKELEDWPSSTIIIAATNHPKLLDAAIWRRFDLTLEIDLPRKEQRKKLLEHEIGDLELINKNEGVLNVISDMTEGLSGAEICKYIEKSKRYAVLYDTLLLEALIIELLQLNNEDSVQFNKKFCEVSREYLNTPIRKLADLLGKSPSTIQYYLKDKGGRNSG
jgi:SpoVK/Ycf46/Vps4 family AAA+-type ATPase